MHTEFEQYLKSQANLDEDAIKAVICMATHRSLAKNGLLLQSGEICRHKVFILNGMLRSSVITANGSEHILQFSPENTWTLDVESYDKEIPSAVNICAVEPTEVLLWKKADFQNLLSEIPGLKNFSQQLISRNIYYSRQRIATVLGGTPEEKYDDFIRTFPGLMMRLPLRIIASYLGMSLKTLTRIRHAQLHREAK